MGKDAYYFKHDYNARHDPKCRALIKKYGVEGYGRYWIILEMCREEKTYKLENKPYVWDALAEQMQCKSRDEAKNFISDCIKEFDLFVQEEDFFYSPAFLERMVRLDEIRQKRVYAANIKHQKDLENQWKV